jgi:hypothetical protein
MALIQILFSCGNRSKIWNNIQVYGILVHTLILIRQTHNRFTCQIVHEGKRTPSIPVISGVRHKDVSCH